MSYNVFMIMHLDLDCFFVSAHRSIDKSLLNIPVAVGGRSNLNIFNKSKQKRYVSENSGAFVSSILSKQEKNPQKYFVDADGRIRGIITTSSYEARACGVKTAMSVNEALSLCPHLHMISPDYPLYHELSYKLLSFLEETTPEVEQFSIDEFFVNLSGFIDDNDVYDFAKYIQNEILRLFNLPISIGLAKSKYLSKVATNYAKPIGIKLVKEEDSYAFIKDMPIAHFTGIGKAYQEKLKAYGISKLGQVRDRKDLFYSWKKPGIQLYNRILGINDFSLEKRGPSKSIGIGRTFDPILKREELKRRVIILCRYLAFLVYKKNVNPQTFYLKIKYEFNLSAKATSTNNRMFSELLLKETVLKMFDEQDIHPSHYVVQLNVTVSNFIEQRMDTFNIFEYESDLKIKKLNSHLNILRDKYGIDIIKTAKELYEDN